MSDSSSGSFAGYANAAARIPALSPELETALMTKYKQSNSITARNQLIEPHIRLVMAIAKQLGRMRDDREDLIQEGNIGLMVALEKYEPTAGVRFAVYATHWIKAHIKEYMRLNHRMIRIVTTKAHQKCFYNLHLYRAEDRSFSQAEIKIIAEELKVPEEDVREMELRLFGRDVSIHLTPEEGGVTDPIIDHCDPATLVERIDWNTKMAAKIDEAINNLDERGRHIFNDRILLKGNNTLEHFSQMYGVSKEAIRQAEMRAFKKVQQHVLAA